MISLTFLASTFITFITITAENVASKVDGDFAVTFEGFFPLVDEDYRLKSVKSNPFRENISLSMYRYYMAQHMYARLALIRRDRSIIDVNERKFLDLVYSASPLLPRPIFEYLNTIGDITVNGTNVMKYAFLIWPNQEGHFGRVDATNHWKYMSFPAPSVVAQAIQEDYGFTVNRSAVPDSSWNLRQNLIPNDNANEPECKSPGYPTQNLLGWKPFTELTLQQRQILQSCLITNRVFDTADTKFYTNPCLLEYMYIILRERSNIFSFKEATPTKYHGLFQKRTLQFGWLLRIAGNDASFSRTAVDTDRGVVGYTALPFKQDEAERILTMQFRVMKSATINTWSIFEWSNYQCVPYDWIDTRNSVSYFGKSLGTMVPIGFSHNKNEVRKKFLEKKNEPFKNRQ